MENQDRHRLHQHLISEHPDFLDSFPFDFHHNHHHLHHFETEEDSCTRAITDHHHHSSSAGDIDLITTLRSELAALTCKRDHLSAELVDIKNTLCSRENECESLRAQVARQSTLITSLQARLQAAENRDHFVQKRCDCIIDTMKIEKRAAEEECKKLQEKINQLATQLTKEETQRDQFKLQLRDLLYRLGTSLGMDICDSAHLSADCVAARVDEVMTEMQRQKLKFNATCDTLASCENELLNLKSLSNIEKQRSNSQLESTSNHIRELESRCRQYEQDLQLQRDRLTETEMSAEKLKDELRGFESRCQRLQTNLDRSQNDRLQFLRSLATKLDLPDPCESLISDKLTSILSDNQCMNVRIHTLQDQLSSWNEKLRSTEESHNNRLSEEEAQKRHLEEEVENCRAEILTLRKDHYGLSEYLHRLARVFNWSDCSSPPALGNETNIKAEKMLERIHHLIQELTALGIDSRNFLHDHVLLDKNICCDRLHYRHPCSSLRRSEGPRHEPPLKESSNIYTLQRRVRTLREQIQRRDTHLELLKRKLALVEDGSRRKCMLQGERDEAASRICQANKQIDKLTAQLLEARTQIAEVEAQLAESVDHKITSLERARKIDELSAKICDLEEENIHLLSQLSASRERFKLLTESAQNRQCRDEMLINTLREDVKRLQTQLADANNSLSRLQSFRTSVARTLHLRDLPETDLLQRLQALCSAHQEFTLLSKRCETDSPVGDHPCPRYDDPILLSDPRRPPNDECLTNCEHHSVHHNNDHHHNDDHYPNDDHRHHGIHCCQRYFLTKERHRRSRKKNCSGDASKAADTQLPRQEHHEGECGKSDNELEKK